MLPSDQTAAPAYTRSIQGRRVKMTRLKTMPPIVELPQMDEPITNLRSYFAKSNRAVKELPFEVIKRAAEALYQAYEKGHRVFLFGNGGSPALPSHFPCDLPNTTASPNKISKRLRALSLADNLALITAWANDTSYEQVFAEQMLNFIQKYDVPFAINASGRSPNVLLALQLARESGATTVGLRGFKGGK